MSAAPVMVNVTPVNHSPTTSNMTVTTPEDTPFKFTAESFSFHDQDAGNLLRSVRFTSLPDKGTLTLDGVAMKAYQIIPVGRLDNLIFTPPKDANGTPFVMIGFQVSDGALFSKTATITINVKAVNDAPTTSNSTVTMLEDTQYKLTRETFRFGDVDAGNLLRSVRFTSLPDKGTLTLDGVAVKAFQIIPVGSLDNLVFTPPKDANGIPFVTFGFQVSDGALFSKTATITINVKPVNDAPTTWNTTVTMLEDTQYKLTREAFPFGDVDAGNLLRSVRFTSLPDKGTLTLNGVAVKAFQIIPVGSLDNLVFTPPKDANGTPFVTIGFQVSDGALFSNAAKLTVNVTPVNDLPTLDQISDPVAIFKDAGQQVINLTGISAGPVDESSQTLTVTVTSSNTALIATPTINYSSPNATGTLTYTPVAGQVGAAVITVTVTDSGGTEGGGVNATSSTFSVTVKATPQELLSQTRDLEAEKRSVWNKAIASLSAGQQDLADTQSQLQTLRALANPLQDGTEDRLLARIAVLEGTFSPSDAPNRFPDLVSIPTLQLNVDQARSELDAAIVARRNLQIALGAGYASPRVSIEEPLVDGKNLSLAGEVVDSAPINPAADFAYAWTIQKDGVTVATATTAQVTFAPDGGGTYTFTLVVTDTLFGGVGYDSKSLDIQLSPQNQPSSATRQWTQIDTSGTAGGLTFSPDGKVLVFSDGPSIIVVPPDTAIATRVFSPHGQATVRAFSISSDGQYVASVGADGTLRFLDFKSGELLRTVSFPKNTWLSRVAWLPGNDAVIVSTDVGIYHSSLDGTSTLVLPYERNAGMTPDGSFIVASQDRFLKFIDPRTFTVHHSIDFGFNKSSDQWVPRSIHIWAIDSTSGTLAVTAIAPGYGYGSIDFYNVADGTYLGGGLNRTGQLPTVLTFSGDGSVLASADQYTNNLSFFTKRDGVWQQNPLTYINVGSSSTLLSLDGSTVYSAGPHGIQAFDTPSSSALETAVQIVPVFGDGVLSPARLQSALASVTTLLEQVIAPAATDPTVISLVAASSSLIDEGTRLEQARQTLDDLFQVVLPPDLKQQWRDVDRQWDVRYQEFQLASERFNAFLDAHSDGNVPTVDLDRYLRSQVQGIDLWNYQVQSESYGRVAEIDAGAGAKIRIVSAGSNQFITHVSPRAGDYGVDLPATLTGIDVSQLDAVTTAVRFHLEAQGTVPLISVYRDGQVIGNPIADADGFVRFEDPLGITEVLVRRTNDSSLSLHSLTVVTDPRLASTQFGPLSAATNPEIARAVGAQSWTIRNWWTNPARIDIDPSRYTLVHVSGYSKDVRIAGLDYENALNSYRSVPDQYIVKLDAYSWIILPGAPSSIDVKVVNGTVWYRGHLGYDWEYSQTVRSAATLQELVPTGPMTIGVAALDRWTPVSEVPDGFLDLRPSQFQQHRAPVGGGRVAFILDIRSSGAVGGSVKIELFGKPSGYDPNDLGSPQKTFWADFHAGEDLKMLRSSIDVPAGPDDTGVVLARFTLPDGTQKVCIATGSVPHRAVQTVIRTWDRETHQINGVQFVNPYTPEEQMRIARDQLRLAQAFAQQGNSAEATRIINGIPIAIQAGGPPPNAAIWTDPVTGVQTYLPLLTQDSTSEVQQFDPSVATLLNDIRSWAAQFHTIATANASPATTVVDAAARVLRAASRSELAAGTVSDGTFLQTIRAALEGLDSPPGELLQLVDQLQTTFENRRIDELIRNVLQLPVDHSAGTWYVQSGSPDHVGTEANAIDLNLRGTNLHDLGEAVRAMADGTVVYVDEAAGQMILRHEIQDPSSGKAIVFFTEYVHMQNMRVELLGQTVTSGTQIGEVGRVAADATHPITSHLHINVIYDGRSVDLTPLVTAPWQLTIEPTTGGAREIGGAPMQIGREQLKLLDDLHELWKMRRETEIVLNDIEKAAKAIHDNIDRGARVADLLNIIFTFWKDVGEIAVSDDIPSLLDVTKLTIIEPLISTFEVVLGTLDVGEWPPELVGDALKVKDFVDLWGKRAAVGWMPLIAAAEFAGTSIQHLIVVSTEWFVDSHLEAARWGIRDSLITIDSAIVWGQVQFMHYRH
jgi:WD40 repeat protein